MSNRVSTIHVLTAAVSNYSPTAGNLSPIPSAPKASSEIEKVFRDRGVGDSIRVWGREECGSPLIDAAATKARILGCLDRILLEAKPEDMVVLFLMGHGRPLPNTELFYFYPFDYHTSPGNGLLSTALNSAELADRFRRLRARRLVLIVDTCDAGAAMEPLITALEAKIRLDQALEQSGQTNSVIAAQPTGVLLVAAATSLEQTGAGTNVNPFINSLVGTLNGEKACGSPKPQWLPNG